MRVLTLVILAVSIGSGQDNRARPIVLVGGTVVDVSAFGASTGDIRDGVVIVQNGRITAVGTRQSTVIPRGAERIDRVMLAGVLIDRAALLRAGT